MREMLASARMRRRLAWGAAFAAAAGAVAALVVLFPSPAPSKEAEVSTVEGDIVLPDKPHAFMTRKKDVLDVASRFVFTAVQRRHVEDSWELAAPALREGFTKKKWGKGNIPVVPFYPVDYARWRVSYSFEKEVDLLVALFPPAKKGVKRRVPTVFDITLQRFQRGGQPSWLVSSFLPHAAGPDEFDATGPPTFASGKNAGGARLVESPHHTTLWLLVPGGILALLLAVMAVVGINGVRDNRAYRAYVRERQSSS
jgi:hypothetical protein